MKNEALNCLDKVIRISPTNTKAHFLKGKFCLAMGNVSCAEERFAVGPVREAYGKEIAALFHVEAINQLNRGDLEKSKRFYWIAINSNPAFKKEACQKFCEAGLKQASSRALTYFSASQEFCPDYKETIGDKILAMAKNTSSDTNACSDGESGVIKNSYVGDVVD